MFTAVTNIIKNHPMIHTHEKSTGNSCKIMHALNITEPGMKINEQIEK